MSHFFEIWEILFDVEKWSLTVAVAGGEVCRRVFVRKSRRKRYSSMSALNGDSLGWIFNVEWLRSLRKRGEVLKSCAKLNGESLGGWYSLLPATNFCSEWSVDRDQYWEGGAPLVLAIEI